MKEAILAMYPHVHSGGGPEKKQRRPRKDAQADIIEKDSATAHRDAQLRSFVRIEKRRDLDISLVEACEGIKGKSSYCDGLTVSEVYHICVGSPFIRQLFSSDSEKVGMYSLIQKLADADRRTERTVSISAFNRNIIEYGAKECVSNPPECILHLAQRARNEYPGAKRKKISGIYKLYLNSRKIRNLFKGPQQNSKGKNHEKNRAV